MKKPPKNMTLVVLGDLGRSPRMQYHAMSLARTGNIVDIIAYGDTQPMDEVKAEPLIFYHYLFHPPRLPMRLVRAKLVIDWHNYAYTIMALATNERHILVKITKKVEKFFGSLADVNFCVTKAMKEDLKKNWNIEAITLYDRPPLIFKPISLQKKHDFLKSFAQKYKELQSEDGNSVFAEETEDGIKLKHNRPGLIVSSTSWTEDEDFNILFEALKAYENHFYNENLRRLPKLVCIITGKGDLKEHYKEKIAQEQWEHITVLTPWLEAKEYPLILASADLGVSLHFSSSGLDLPMKVVDMFGCGLPVCAYNYYCLNELVKNYENSYTFNTSGELADQIQSWFEHFPDNENQKEIEKDFKKQLEVFQDVRWDLNWNKVASKVFE